MNNEHAINEQMERMYGESYNRLREEHTWLSKIWANMIDPDMMLQLLDKSHYKLGYYEELCDYARWVRSQSEQFRNENYEKTLADYKQSVLADAGERGITSDALALKMWGYVIGHIRAYYLTSMYSDANSKALWEGRHPDADDENYAFKIKLRADVEASQSQRLFELINNPFLPNIK